VEFYEKRRRRSSGIWFSGLAGKAEEEVCWEVWTLDVTIATPRTESGMSLPFPSQQGL
jgi:autophagy-related protein 101